MHYFIDTEFHKDYNINCMQRATHHYHFHGVRDQERCLTLMSADCSDDWKHIPELTPINQYYCVQLE